MRSFKLIQVGASELAAVSGKHTYVKLGSKEYHAKWLRVLDRSRDPKLIEILSRVSPKMTKRSYSIDALDEEVDNIVKKTGLIHVADDKVEKTTVTKVKDTLGKLPEFKTMPTADVEKVAESMVSKSAGRVAEPTVVLEHAVKENNAKWYSFFEGRFRVFGHIDGFRDGELVEIKNRRNRLFTRVVEYERIQCLALMRMTGQTTCQLLQKYKSGSSSFTVKYSASKMNEIMEALKLRAVEEETWLNTEGEKFIITNWTYLRREGAFRKTLD